MAGLFLAWLCIGAAEPEISADTGPADDGARIENLIRQLGDADWRSRENAQAQIERIGLKALPHLKEASQSADPEIRFRAQSLLGRIDPLEIQVLLLALRIPDTAPTQWSVSACDTLQGSAGKISLPDFGNYHVSLQEDTLKKPKISIKLSAQGSINSEAMIIPENRENCFWIMERRVGITTRQDGVRLSVTQEPFLLVAWTRLGHRSGLAQAGWPFDCGQTAKNLRPPLTQCLLNQLTDQAVSTAARLDAADILSRMGETRMTPLLSTLPDSTPADVIRARMGQDDRHADIIQAARENRNVEVATAQLLTLAEMGNATALSILINRLDVLSNYLMKRVLFIAAQKLKDQADSLSPEEKRKIIKAVSGQTSGSLQTTGQYLLHIMGQDKHTATAILLPAFKQTLTEPAASSTHLSTALMVIKTILARHDLPRETISILARLAASHTLSTGHWQAVSTLLPYLVKAGGPAVLDPFIHTACARLDSMKSTYPLKNVLTALALATPHPSDAHAALVAKLAPQLKSPPTQITRAVTEALSILLRRPTGTISSADIKALKAAAGQPIKPQAFPVYDIHLWQAEKNRDHIDIRHYGQFRAPLMKPIPVADMDGNLRYMVLYPQISAIPQSVRLITSGASTYVKQQEPIQRGLFPDLRLKTVYQSDQLMYERYKQTSDFLDMVIYLEPARPGRPPEKKAWTDLIAATIQNLDLNQTTRFRSCLRLISTLHITQAIPALKTLFKKTQHQEVAATLFTLGDPTGLAYLEGQLSGHPRKQSLSAIKLILSVKPDNPKALKKLITLIQTNKEKIELYTLSSCARTALQGTLTIPQRQSLLRALADLLNPVNAMSIIPTLKMGTGLDFGYYDTMRIKQASEKAKHLEKVIRAWKQAHTQNPTDKD